MYICAGLPTSTSFVTNIDDDAKGQRTCIVYGNGVTTIYAYDPLTFRLTLLRTLRGAAQPQIWGDIEGPGGAVPQREDESAQAYVARSGLHLRSGRQYHAHPRRRPADPVFQ